MHVLPDFFTQPFLEPVPWDSKVHLELGAHVRGDVGRDLDKVEVGEGVLGGGEG